MIEIFLTGGPVMYLLLVCSVVAMTVIFDRSIFWIRNGKTSNDLSVADLCKLANSDSPRYPDDANPSAVMRVLRIGLDSWLK